MTATTDIALNKLVAWDGNVRKSGADLNIAELTASIAAHGLLQSLVVRKHTRGRFAVVAGGRRLLALQSLAAAGTISKDLPVSCTVIGPDANATEISLVENAQREQMHPADEFEAFHALTEQGLPMADIAARFGVSDTVVKKRLKLAKVSPVILEAYRNDELTLEQVMAFALSDDHAAQERVFAAMKSWNGNPDAIRDALTEGEIAATDRRVRFVTLAAYEESGGGVRRDLFAEGDEGMFVLDTAILDRLVTEKLMSFADEVRAEGWKWVEASPVFSHAEWADCQRAYPEPVPLSVEEQAELDSLTGELDALAEIPEEELTPEHHARCDEIDERIAALQDRQEAYFPETVRIGGAVVTLGHDGEPDVRRGYIRPEDIPHEVDSGDPETGAEASADDGPKPPVLSASLTESLTGQRSAALTAALMDRPDIALACVVHAIAISVYERYRAGTCLQFSIFRKSLRLTEGSKANDAIEQSRQVWRGILPESDRLFAWCLEQDRERLLELMAFCAALSVDAVQAKGSRVGAGDFAHADELAAALALDMSAWFTPDAQNYFGRVTKPQILDALLEARGGIAPAWHGMKKAELAALAEREIAGTGWLPQILRPASEEEPVESAA